MRCSRVLGAVASLSSLLMCSAVGCANSAGDTIIFGSDGGPDGGPHGGNDATIRSDTGAREAGFDAFVSADVFVEPSPDGSGDTGVGPGFDAGFDGGLVYWGPPGSPCATLGAVQVQACGRCGTQTSTCVVRPDGGIIAPSDGGTESGTGHDAMTTDSGREAGAQDSGHDAGGSDGGPDGVAADGSAEGGGHDATVDAGSHDAAAETGADAAHVSQEGGASDAAKDAGKDASSPYVWSLFGACASEIDGGCLPGTSTTVSCGTCGTQTILCEPDCEYGVTSCQGQVANGCLPGSVDFQVVPACAVDGGVGGKLQTCNSSCSWGDASTSCTVAPNALTASVTPSAKVDTIVNLTAAQTALTLMSGNCPVSLANGNISTPYAYVKVTNPSATKALTASIWTSQPSGAPKLDTEITTYSQMPGSTTEREQNCVNVLTDTCSDTSDPTSCPLNGTYGGLMIGDLQNSPPLPPANQTNAVVVPGGGTVLLFLQLVNPGDSGEVRLTVRTESLQ